MNYIIGVLSVYANVIHESLKAAFGEEQVSKYQFPSNEGDAVYIKGWPAQTDNITCGYMSVMGMLAIVKELPDLSTPDYKSFCVKYNFNGTIPKFDAMSVRFALNYIMDV